MGEAVSRFLQGKVVVLQTGGRGITLSPTKVSDLFSKRGLKPIFVTDVNALPADARIIFTIGSPVGVDVLAKVPRLELVAVGFTGVDHIDVETCRRRGITVTNVPNYSTDATAELAIGLVISSLRGFSQCHAAVEAGHWLPPVQEDLSTKTIGIIGVGKIGYRLAELFKAFNVKGIRGYDIEALDDQAPPAPRFPGWSPKPQGRTKDLRFATLGGLYVQSLASLFLDSDIICVCLPLTDQTKGMVSERMMELLRPNCLLVNISRGAVVDENALARLLQEGQFRAALDVYSTEPLSLDSPLRKVPPTSLLMTPHVGYQSVASVEKLIHTSMNNILAFLAGEAVNVVA